MTDSNQQKLSDGASLNGIIKPEPAAILKPEPAGLIVPKHVDIIKAEMPPLDINRAQDFVRCNPDFARNFLAAKIEFFNQTQDPGSVALLPHPHDREYTRWRRTMDVEWRHAFMKEGAGRRTVVSWWFYCIDPLVKPMLDISETGFVSHATRPGTWPGESEEELKSIAANVNMNVGWRTSSAMVIHHGDLTLATSKEDCGCGGRNYVLSSVFGKKEGPANEARNAWLGAMKDCMTSNPRFIADSPSNFAQAQGIATLAVIEAVHYKVSDIFGVQAKATGRAEFAPRVESFFLCHNTGNLQMWDPAAKALRSVLPSPNSFREMQDMIYLAAKGLDQDAQPWRTKSIYVHGYTPAVASQG